MQIVVSQMLLDNEDEDDDEYEADKRCITIVLVLDKGVFQKSTSEVFSKPTLSESEDQAD